MKRIYIAGPYDGKNVIEILGNIRRGIQAARKLMEYGYAFYCPFLDFQIAFMEGEEIPKEAYQANSMAWVEVCDAILLLPGWESSQGVARELKRANALGIMPYTDIDELWERDIEDGLI